MHSLYGRPVFRVDEEAFLWEDVLLDGVERGRWAGIERQTRQGLAAVAHFEASGAESPEEQIEEAAREFRYDRDLITAQELKRWLADRELDAEQWLDHIRRQVLRTSVEARLERLLEGAPAPSAAEFEAALRVDFICSGIGRALAVELAERAAAAAAAGLDAPDPANEPAPTLSRLPLGLSPARAAERIPRLVRIERAAVRFRQTAVTGALVQKEIAAHRMEWIRVDCRALSFSAEAEAREAALCVREDGESLDDVGAAAHAPVFDSRFYLDELEPEQRTLFLTARPVDVLGPVASDQGYTLYRVLSKEPPSDGDPEIIRRAESSILARALAEEVHRRVRWDFVI